MKKTFLLIFTPLLVLTSCDKATPFVPSIKPSEVGSIIVHSQMINDFFNAENYDARDLPAEVDAKTDLGDNLPINITWESNYKDEVEYHLVFDDNTQILNYFTSETSFEFNNYKLNTTYNFHIEVDDYKSESISFTTPKGFARTIKVEGVGNFRDLGDGENIKQGLIYRSMTFENNTIANSPFIDITENGIKELKNLGIKSEIDLRKADERGENFGKIEGINYQFFPLYYGGQNVLIYKNSEYDNAANVRQIFDFMADEKNYPMDFHCIRGTDRTGCIAFVVKALFGISEEMLKKDFIFSNFYNIGSQVRLDSIEYTVNPNAETKFLNIIKKEEGETLQEKTYNCLVNRVGVSTETLDKIIEILKVNNE